MNRLMYNTAIINKLKELIIKYPDWRFGQILVNCGIIETSLDDLTEGPTAKDPFYEESKITWKKMCNNKICFTNKKSN